MAIGGVGGAVPGGLPEHASLARRLGDSVGDDGAPAAPRRLMLASVFGEPALVPFHPSPQRKQGNSGRQHLPR
jgi:hypothetical protein